MIFNVTNISNIVYCDSMSEYYNLVSSDIYDEFTLYIVDINHNLLLYYGLRRLTDILSIDSSSPTLPESPTNKFYLEIGKNINGDMCVKNVYYKYLPKFRKPTVATIDKGYIKLYKELDTSTSHLEISDGSSGDIILGFSSSLDESVVEKIKESILRRVSERYRSDGDILWRTW